MPDKKKKVDAYKDADNFEDLSDEFLKGRIRFQQKTAMNLDCMCRHYTELGSAALAAQVLLELLKQCDGPPPKELLVAFYFMVEKRLFDPILKGEFPTGKGNIPVVLKKGEVMMEAILAAAMVVYESTKYGLGEMMDDEVRQEKVAHYSPELLELVDQASFKIMKLTGQRTMTLKILEKAQADMDARERGEESESEQEMRKIVDAVDAGELGTGYVKIALKDKDGEVFTTIYGDDVVVQAIKNIEKTLLAELQLILNDYKSGSLNKDKAKDQTTEAIHRAVVKEVREIKKKSHDSVPDSRERSLFAICPDPGKHEMEQAMEEATKDGSLPDKPNETIH